MQDYSELVEALRLIGKEQDCNECEAGKWHRDINCCLFEDAAAAIEELQAEAKKTITLEQAINRLRELGWLQEHDKILTEPINDLQARLEEAENSVENYKRMWLEKHEPKVGRWNAHGIDDGFLVERYTCSNCDYYSGTKKTKFLPELRLNSEDFFV